MHLPRTVEFGGPADELEKYLLEFARLSGGSVARPARGGWILSGGARMSTNPNTFPWRLRFSLGGGAVAMESVGSALPWARAKASRVAGQRLGQAADYLTTRARGRGPESFDRARLLDPFASFGEDAASRCLSFAWAVLTGLAAVAGAVVAATLAAWPLMALAIGEITARAAAIDAAGSIGLPHAAERAAMAGAGFTLGCAISTGLPIGFFAGIVHAAALAACDLWGRAQGLPIASALFLSAFVTAALFPFLPVLALPLALLVPAGAHLAASLVWARRRERLRETPLRRGPIAAIVGVVLAGTIVASVAPTPSNGDTFNLQLALFRDRALLGSDAGKALASVYYRHTLVAADPQKEFYSLDKDRAVRSQRTSTFDSDLRTLHFTPVKSSAEADVHQRGGELWHNKTLPPTITMGNPDDPESLKRGLDELSRRTFRGGALRSLSGMGWRSLAYAGPVVLLLVAAAPLSVLAGLALRRLSPKAAMAAFAGTFAISSTILLASVSGSPDAAAALRRLRESPGPETVAESLAHASSAVRHEAAVRAFVDDAARPVDALLRAVGDPDLRVRLWAVAALGRTKDPRAFDRIVPLLDDPELFVRYRAAEGLGFLKDPRAVDPLVSMMRGRSWYEGSYALQALRRIEPGRF